MGMGHCSSLVSWCWLVFFVGSHAREVSGLTNKLRYNTTILKFEMPVLTNSLRSNAKIQEQWTRTKIYRYVSHTTTTRRERQRYTYTFMHKHTASAPRYIHEGHPKESSNDTQKNARLPPQTQHQPHPNACTNVTQCNVPMTPKRMH